MLRISILLFQLSFVVVVGMFLYSHIQSVAFQSSGQEVHELINVQMPIFTFEDLNGTQFSTSDLPTCSAYLIVYFNSECPSCETKLNQINQYARLFTNTHILFISDQSEEDLSAVKVAYDMFNSDNFILLRDSNFKFGYLFQASSYPTLFIYNQEKTLIERIDHPIDIKSLIKITRFAYSNS